MHLSSMGVAVTPEAVERAADAFDRLTKSIEQATDAIQKLNGAGFGGIRVTSVGNITEILITPPS